MYKLITNSIGDLIHFIFPNECIICNKETPSNYTYICHLCEQELEFTKMEVEYSETKTKKIFWGRIPLEEGFSLLYFSKGNLTQKILHEIKYQNRKLLTFQLGEKIGEKLKDKELIKQIDLLIPVPLHPNKFFDRGYNQSEILSRGMSKHLKIETENNLIFRIKNNKSQTRLNRFLRWENAQNIYSVSNEIQNPKLKHIALVDDVITTGSTVESIALEILKKNPKIKISVISLALAI